MLELAILGLLKEQDLHGYELKKRLTDSLGTFSSVSFGSLYPALARLEAAGAVKAVEAATEPLGVRGAKGSSAVSGPLGASANGANGAVGARGLSGRGATDTAVAIPMTGSLAGEAAAFRLRLAKGARPRPRPRAGGRARKAYGITERGHRLFEELLAADGTGGGGGPGTEDDRAFNLRLAFCRYLPQDARLGLLERRRAHLVERLARARGAIRSGRERLDTYTRSLMEHGTEATERDISWLDSLIATERGRTRAGADPDARTPNTNKTNERGTPS
ncbi:MAG: PadR family transcriptional regulator [Acidimicrobiales bacterium]